MYNTNWHVYIRNINDTNKHTRIHIIIIMVHHNFQKKMWCWKCVGGFVVFVVKHDKIINHIWISNVHSHRCVYNINNETTVIHLA